MSCVEDKSEQLCRLCLRNTEDCVSIFSNNPDENVVDLPEIVKNCIGVEVSKFDGYTCMICRICRKMAVRFNGFREACLESQTRLKESCPGNKGKNTKKGRRMQERGKAAKVGGVATDDKSDGNTTTYTKPVVTANKDLSLRPLAMWTVSEGCWRSTTDHNEETIISDQLEEDWAAGVPTDADEEYDKAMPEVTRRNQGAYGDPLDDHNYFSTTLGEEPLQLCRVVMDQEDAEKEDCEEEGPSSKDSLEQENEPEKVAEAPKQPAQRSIARIPIPRFPLTTPQLIHRRRLILPNFSAKFKSLNGTKGPIITGLARLCNGQLELKNNISDYVKRIIISRNGGQIKHIPLVKARPLQGKTQNISVLKMKKLTR